MNILVIPVQTVSDLITNSSSEVFILETGKTCEEVNTILNTFTSGFSYPEVFSLKDFREWRKKLRSGEIEEDWSYPGSIFSIANGWFFDPQSKYRTYVYSNKYREPIHAAMVINVQDKTIHKRQAYKCSVCHKWHVGRGKTILTDEDKRKLKIKHNIR